MACGPATVAGDGAGESSSTSAETLTSTTTDDPMSTSTSASASVGDSSSGTSSSDSGDDADTTEGPIIFDVLGGPDAPPVDPRCAGEKNGAMVQGFIWIANSEQGTVSKIDTVSLTEVGRYITRPDSNGNPSRTSVNRNGDVVVANRSGGVVMIHADTAYCPDATNTSTGADDLVAWPDGCVGWYTPMAYASQRPVAWTAGTFDERTCRYEDVDVWTSGADNNIDVLLLDGESGAIEDTVPIVGVAANFYGLYGGAVDSQDHFWASQLSTGHLVRVDRETLEVETWPMPVGGYGMTVDRHDRIWTCSTSAARFEYETETWETAPVGGLGGCAPGLDDTLWLANSPIVQIDTETLEVLQTIAVSGQVHGISVDFAGQVWGVPVSGTNAFRIDPVTGIADTVTGLVQAYTYSDMTGTALAIVSGQL